MTPRLRVGAAVLAATTLVLGIAMTMAARVPDVRDTPLAPDHLGLAGVPVELTFEPAGTGQRRAVTTIEVFGPHDWLVGADELRVALATFGTAPALIRAELRDAGGGCRFTAPRNASIRDNQTMPLVRAGPCGPLGTTPLVLEVEVGAGGRVGLWTYDVPNRVVVGEGLRLVPNPADGRHHVLRGRVLATRSPVQPQRAELVAYLWTGTTDARRLWIGLFMAWLLLAAGLAWLVAGPASPLSTLAGASVTAAVVAGLWAVVIPPLQGADEPDHVLSYAEVVGRPVTADLEALARRTHFERIRFRWLEQFRPMHVGAPADVAWSRHVHSERMERRSPLAIALWRLADATMTRPDDLTAAALVLRLRLFNAIGFALAVGLAAALMTWRGSRWPLAALAVIPALAPFAVTVSDWAFVASGSVLLAGALVAIVTDRGPEWLRGLVLGGAVAVTVSASIAGLTLIPLIAAVLAARIALGPAGNPAPGQTAAFWLGLTASGALGIWVSFDLLSLGYFRGDQKVGSDGRVLLDLVNAGLGRVGQAPWLLLLVPMAGALAERAAVRLRDWPDVVTAGRRLVLGSTAAVAVAVAAILTVSAVVPLPVLPVLEGRPAAQLVDYVNQVLLVFVTSLRLTQIDHLMFASFWSGFGWIDTILPTPVLTVLAAGTALGLVLGLIRLFRSRRHRQMAWTLAMLAGVLGAVAAVALAGGLMVRNVHGRYLLAAYVPLIAVAWQGWCDVAAGKGAPAAWVGMTLAVGLVILQTYVFAFVLARYF